MFIQTKFLLSKIFGLHIKPICITLYYHSIFDDEVKSFDKQISLLTKKTKILKANYFGKLDSGRRYSIITFDDGFENLLTNAIPILEKYKAPFTIFFITNYFGKQPGWEFPEYHKDKNEKVMSIEQLNKLPQSLLTMGSHTVNHKKLTTLNSDELKYELTESKKQLENITKTKIDLLSFPNGDYNQEVLNEAFNSGYKRVFTIEPEFSLQKEDEKITHRVWTNGSDNYLEFWLKVHGGYCWLGKSFKLKKLIWESVK